MKMLKYIIIVILIVYGTYTNLLASDYPIITLHGIQGIPVAKNGWPTWANSYSAMRKILNEEYKGYKWGLTNYELYADSCWENTNLQPMSDTKRIYNFSYYNTYSSRGVIGSDGKYEPVRYTAEYKVSNANRQYGYILTQFIYKVLHACYGNNWIYNPNAKVNIVVHSMGGLVARSALTYYLEANRVNKLLFVGTPNQSFSVNEFVEAVVSNWIGGTDLWQKKGELLEMGVDWLCLLTPETRFKDNNGVTNQWSNWLRHNEIINDYTTRYATIAGDRAASYSVAFPPNDGAIMVDQVHLDNAEFNAVVYEQHSYDNDIPELCETSSSFTTEFIKKWMIDDEVKMTDIGSNFAYDAGGTGNPYHWAKGCLRIRSAALNYNNSLITLVRLQKKVFKKDKGDTTKTLYDVYTKAFQIYKYSRSFPGDPVFLVNKIHWEFLSEYWLTIWDMDMTGQIKYSRETIHLEDGDSAYVTLSHINGCFYVGNSTSFTWTTNDYAVYQKLYYKKNNGNWTFLDSLNGNTRNYTFTPPSTGTYHIKIDFYLDKFTPIPDISNQFVVISPPPPYLYLNASFELGTPPNFTDSRVRLEYGHNNKKEKEIPDSNTIYDLYRIYKDGNLIKSTPGNVYYDNGFFPNNIYHIYYVEFWQFDLWDTVYVGNSPDVNVYGGDTSGYGCPYFYIKENGEYIPQNTIMHYGYSNKQDHYLFSLGSRYKEELRKNRITDDRFESKERVIEGAISENEVEKDYIDRINLKAVKYDSTYNLTLNTKGEYLFWKDIYKIDSCKNAKGEDILPFVENMGDSFYLSYSGDTIYIYSSTRCCDKANTSGKDNRGGGIITGLGVKPKDKGKGKDIEPSIDIEYTGGKSWVNGGEIYPREYICASYNDIPLSDSIRFIINNEVKIDYISFPISENVKYNKINLELINPTLKGKNVMKQIIKEDSVYINLINGDTLYFSFPLISLANGEKVSYILETDGYYNMDNKRDKSESNIVKKNDIKFISGIVYLQSKGKIFSNYEIYNISGRNVGQGEIKTDKIKLQKLCNGIYFIKLKGEHISETHKFEVIR